VPCTQLTLSLSCLPTLPCSNDPAAKGAPSGFTFSVREVRVAAGAGWLIAVCGDMMTIPGLPTRPAFYEIDIDPETGRVLGLS
jgi:formyltetrahydrofolate synthetase